MVNDYIVIDAMTHYELATSVKINVKSGWQPLGRPFVENFIWYQAMTFNAKANE